MAKPPAGTAALLILTKAKVDYQVHEYEHSAGETHFGQESTRQLGLDPARVFKTLLAEVTLASRSQLVVGVVPVAGQMDLKALAQAVGAKKAAMTTPAQAEKATGYVVGGISPLGQSRRHLTVIDASATDFETIYVSGGRRGLQVELAPQDLITLSGAIVAPIAR